MSLPRIPLTPCYGEIGRNGDWNSFALVEEIGASNDGKTKIMQTLDRGRFELWHKSGLKMRIPIEAMLDEACEALRHEAADASTCPDCGVAIIDRPASGFIAKCGRRVLEQRAGGCPGLEDVA